MSADTPPNPGATPSKENLSNGKEPAAGEQKTPSQQELPPGDENLTPSQISALLKLSDKEDANPKVVNKDLIYQELEELEWYHGNILDEDVKKILIRHGDFVIRTIANGNDGDKMAVVTVLWKGALLDLAIHSTYADAESETAHTLDKQTSQKSVKELIRKHQMMSVPVCAGKGLEVLLLNPIAKQEWELRAESVELVKKLGEGAFGEVHAGKLRLRMKKSINVAIKVIKRCANNEKATKELQKEATLMRNFKHSNIVVFHGMVVGRDKIMIVMELINGGGLDNYLRKHTSKVTIKERGGYSYDIACGLAYLHMQGVMHRDVACRNCLIDLTKKIAKLSDFGLAKQANEYRITGDDRLPVRWIAPEVLKSMVYTMKSDVYSYGILVWEIFNDASMPFGGMTNAQIKDGLQDDDFRPKFAADTPSDIIDAVTSCWATDPNKRPELIDVARKSLIKFSTKQTAKDDKKGGDKKKNKARAVKSSSIRKRSGGETLFRDTGARQKEKKGSLKDKLTQKDKTNQKDTVPRKQKTSETEKAKPSVGRSNGKKTAKSTMPATKRRKNARDSHEDETKQVE